MDPSLRGRRGAGVSAEREAFREGLEHVQWDRGTDEISSASPSAVLTSEGWRRCEAGNVVVPMVNFEFIGDAASAHTRLLRLVEDGYEAHSSPKLGRLYIRSPWTEYSPGVMSGRFGCILFL